MDWWMLSPDEEICRVFRIDQDDFQRYKACWQATTGVVWAAKIRGEEAKGMTAEELKRQMHSIKPDGWVVKSRSRLP